MYYCEGDASAFVMQNSEHADLAGKMRNTAENLRNPFTDLYHWNKGEIYDLNAFSAAHKEYLNC